MTLEAANRIEDFSEISPVFKVLVADLAATFSMMESEAVKIQRSFSEEDCDDYVSNLSKSIRTITDRFKLQFDPFVSALPAELQEEYRAYCQAHLRHYLIQSPFLKRALEKPFGYAGDYEMMNMLYRSPYEGDTLFGQAMNLCFTNEPAAIANKNRISYINDVIVKLFECWPAYDQVNVMSIGCGPAFEIGALLSLNPRFGGRLHVTLVDQDARAIAHCKETFRQYECTGVKIDYHSERLRTFLSPTAERKFTRRYQLIYSAGLFDYFDDRVFCKVAEVLYGSLLAESGTLMIGNVAEHNPSRWVMEYFTKWFLQHRSAEQLKKLAGAFAPTARDIVVDAEPSGVNLFLKVRK